MHLAVKTGSHYAKLNLGSFSGMDSERNFGLNDSQNWKTCSRSGDCGCRGRFCFLLVCTYLSFLNSTVASVFQLVFQPLFVINWTFTCLEVSVNCV